MSVLPFASVVNQWTVAPSHYLAFEVEVTFCVRGVLMRRLENVRGEFSLTALAYNMRRAINLVGVPTLVEAACP